MVLRNNNRYSGSFYFAQQKPLQRRVCVCALVCATITVTITRLVFAQQNPLQRHRLQTWTIVTANTLHGVIHMPCNVYRTLFVTLTFNVSALCFVSQAPRHSIR